MAGDRALMRIAFPEILRCGKCWEQAISQLSAIPFPGLEAEECLSDDVAEGVWGAGVNGYVRWWDGEVGHGRDVRPWSGEGEERADVERAGGAHPEGAEGIGGEALEDGGEGAGVVV